MIIRFHLCIDPNRFELHSAATMLAQKLGGSHFAVELEDCAHFDKGPNIIEAIDSGVGVKPRADWDKTYSPVRTWTFKLTAEEAERVVEALKPYIGKPYSHRQIALIGMGTLFGFMKALIGRREINGTLAAICSEIAGAACIALGYDFEESVDTIDLRDVVQALNNLTRTRAEVSLC